MSETQTDAELFEAGRRARGKAQCGSLIVATDGRGERNYHLCSDADNHPHETHGCGCGQEWSTAGGRLESRGPLGGVVFP